MNLSDINNFIASFNGEPPGANAQNEPVNRPAPAKLTTQQVPGPYETPDGRYICEICKNVYIKSYYKQHKLSGACQRSTKRKPPIN